MSLTLGYLLTTVAAQAGSAYFNCSRSAKQAKEFARKQRDFEERVLREGIENSRREFAEVCSLQREIENQLQEDRMQLIRDNHNTTLMLEAYRHSLNNWPLFVPPFVIKNECLPLLVTKKQDDAETIAVNCILTPSMDSTFNLKLFPLLEEYLAQFFSRYWPTNSVKAIRFYQQSWRDNIKDVGSRMHDLKAHLCEVPTIVLSPNTEDGKLKFSFSWWGMSGKAEDEHVLEPDNTFDPELIKWDFSHMEYTSDNIERILAELLPKIEAFICYFADLYYWNFYHLAPALPSLIATDSIKISDKEEYANQYSNLLSTFLKGSGVVDNLSEIWVAFSPILSDTSHLVDETISYINRLPDNLRIEQEDTLYTLEEQGISYEQTRGIEELKSDITLLQKKQFSGDVIFSISKHKNLYLNEIVKTMIQVSKSLPRHDTFNIIINKKKLYAVSFFTMKDEIVLWEKKGIYVFLSKSLMAPSKLFDKELSMFSCPSNQLSNILTILESIMTKKEIIDILDSRYDQLKQSLIPVGNQLEDVFADFVSQVKNDLSKEFKSREADQFNRKELKYEDVVAWLRQAREAMGEQRFNGAFLTKQKAGFFDKYPNKLYICLTNDKQPLVENNHPKGVFCYQSTDDSLDDMFGKNDSVQLNFT